MVDIREITSASGLKKFIRFQYSLYKGSPYFVPPLFTDEMNTMHWKKNPAFEYCEARYWLAFRDHRIVGRIGAIINKRYNVKWGRRHMRFGWFDFVDDAEVSSALILKVEEWARETGLDAVHGPLGFCDMDKEGMLIEGFGYSGTFIAQYNYPYYPVHMERLGYGKDVDWVEYRMKVPAEVPADLVRIAGIVSKRTGMSIFHATTPADLRPFARPVFNLLNQTYADLYGVVELTERQIDAYTRQLFGFIDPRFAKIILDADGKLAAFGITMPSLAGALRKAGGYLFPFGFIHLLCALKRPAEIEMALVAVRPDLQNKGLNAILIYEITKACIENGIKEADSNPELETNNKVREQWKFFSAVRNKRRRCWIKSV